MVRIRQAQYPRDAVAVLEIFREFVTSPSVSLEHQDYETEFANLPGKYAPPDGRLLVAEHQQRVVGCVALRKVSDTICEMRRLYVRPEARRRAIGRQMVERLLREASGAGYREMRLDVLDEFKYAQRLYRDLGFTAADPVSFNPLPGTLFLGLKLP